ncbi:hypothetical protein [Ralstonia solanacearum]|nr:hypothetical protein [Ralstonia solanacearum]
MNDVGNLALDNVGLLQSAAYAKVSWMAAPPSAFWMAVKSNS